MDNKWPSEDTQHNLINELITNLNQINSFGYKVITNKETDLLTNWYSWIHGQSIQIVSDKIKLFSEPGVMFAYLIFGLTKPNQRIGLCNLIDCSLRNTVIDLQRTPCMINLFNQDQISRQSGVKISQKLKNQLQNCKIVFLSNPDPYINKTYTNGFLQAIVQVCMQKQIYVIVDQRQIDLHPNLPTFLSLKYEKLIIIRKIGAIMEKIVRPKHLAIFGSQEILRTIQKSPSKSLKILPGDLTLKLIQIQMGPKSLQYRHEIIQRMKINYQLLNTFLFLAKKKIEQPQKYNRYFLLQKSQIKSNGLIQILLKSLPFQPIQYQPCAVIPQLSNYYKLDLRIQTSIIVSKITQLRNLLTLGKL